MTIASNLIAKLKLSGGPAVSHPLDPLTAGVSRHSGQHRFRMRADKNLRVQQEIRLTSKAVRSHSSSLPIPLERVLFNSVSLREPPKLLVLKHLGVVQDPEVQAATGEITRQAIVSTPSLVLQRSTDLQRDMSLGSPARFRYCSGFRSHRRPALKSP
jgi:hypothetical protein